MSIRKIIVVLAAVLFLYAAFNPPWRITVKDSKGHTKRTELVWSYLGTSPRVDREYYQSAAIARDVLGIEFFCVFVSAAAALFIVRAAPVRSPASARPDPEQIRKELSELPGADKDLFPK